MPKLTRPMERNIIVAPSLLSADFGRLAEDVEDVCRKGADWLHLDIMDGSFVPNISFGFPVVEAVAGVSTIPLDAHFMIVHPENYIVAAAKAGVAVMTVHAEACTHLHRTIQQIRAAGMKAGVALNPATPVSALECVVEDIDLALVMSVNPGFGGQKFIPHAVEKVAALRRMIDMAGSGALIEVDGGVQAENAALLADAGADVLVSGSYIFGATDRAAAIRAVGCR